jgi:uncharacterized phage protein (TIGR02220 family)
VQFDDKLASEIGLNEAILYAYLEQKLIKNNLSEIKISLRTIASEILFLSKDTINRTLQRLKTLKKISIKNRGIYMIYKIKTSKVSQSETVNDNHLQQLSQSETVTNEPSQNETLFFTYNYMNNNEKLTRPSQSETLKFEEFFNKQNIKNQSSKDNYLINNEINYFRIEIEQKNHENCTFNFQISPKNEKRSDKYIYKYIYNNKEKKKINKKRKESNFDLSAQKVIEYLNLVAGTNYRKTTLSHQKFIIARLKENVTIENCKLVIDKQVKRWKGTEMEKYLRPDTLFRSQKFYIYLDQPLLDNKEVKVESRYDQRHPGLARAKARIIKQFKEGGFFECEEDS